MLFDSAISLQSAFHTSLALDPKGIVHLMKGSRVTQVFLAKQGGRSVRICGAAACWHGQVFVFEEVPGVRMLFFFLFSDAFSLIGVILDGVFAFPKRDQRPL